MTSDDPLVALLKEWSLDFIHILTVQNVTVSPFPENSDLLSVLEAEKGTGSDYFFF